MKKAIIYFFITALLITAGYIIYTTTKKVPLLTEIIDAQQAYKSAIEAGAKKYDHHNLVSSQKYLDSARVEFSNQTSNISVLRNYLKARNYARKSTKFGKLAKSNSENYVQNLQGKLYEKIKVLTDIANESNRMAGIFPIETYIRKSLANGNLELQESSKLLLNNEPDRSAEKIISAERHLNKAYSELKKLTSEYFSEHRTWRATADKAIRESKLKNTTFLLADKCAHSLSLIRSGRVEKVYDIDLGQNWMGNKLYRGDNATPEGQYHITQKKSNKSTKYYKALLLNYPNDSDKIRFQELKKEGVISKNASIGSLIEIHGGGGKGVDWTNGCIALSNEDMDHLYSHVSEGISVLIIGSYEPLIDVLNNGESRIASGN